jgi:heat shock protein HslJ
MSPESGSERRGLLMLASLTALTVGACGSGNDDETTIDDGSIPPPPVVIGTSWEFTAGGGPDGDVPLVEGHPITIRFDADQFSGTAACNQYTGTYLIDGSDLLVNDIVQTEIGCEPPGVMTSEQTYLSLLSTVNEVTVSGGSLVLGNSETELSFGPSE